MSKVAFTVFTKAWKEKPIPELAAFIRDLGFDGVELPVRPGFPVEPDSITELLPQAAQQFQDAGVRIDNITCTPSEKVIAACGEAGVDLIRVCVNIPADETYLEAEARVQREYEALAPALDRHGVRIGVQNHCDRCVGSAIGTYRLIEPFDPKHICAVWDQAHCARDGEPAPMALEILWPRLGLVNLKNAYPYRLTGTEAEAVEWKWRWTTGRQGMASWPEIASELNKRGYEGSVCLCAEYTDKGAVERLIAEDLAFAKTLF